eukprot:SM000173S03029  [mRNA]  locus=s173:201011:202688:- [translate_table: standard]
MAAAARPPASGWRPGEDPNGRDGPGRTPLHRLCQRGSLSPAELADVRRLLDAGADANARDSFGRAPLGLVCMESGDAAAVRTLVAAGARADAQDDWGRTALHWCCDRGWVEAARMLLQHGADVNILTKQGDSPLLWAVKGGHLELVSLLLESGANVLLQNNRDESPLDVSRDDCIRKLLLVERESNAADLGQSSSRKLGECTAVEGSGSDEAQGAADAPAVSDGASELTTKSVASSSGHVQGTVAPAFSSYSRQLPGTVPSGKKIKISLKKK